MHSLRRNLRAAEKHPANPIVHGDDHRLDRIAYVYGAQNRNPEYNMLRMWYQSYFNRFGLEHQCHPRRL